MPESAKKQKPVTGELEMEIFAVGVWNGTTYTEKDIEAMVKSFESLKGKVDPPLKLGHTDQQKFWPQKDGAPALGWVKELKKVGTKLVAVFTAVPKVVVELVQKGAYRKRSAEIWHDLKVGNKTYSRVLKAVALLGTDLPAVQTLNDIVALYVADHVGTDFEAKDFAMPPTVVEFEESMNAKQSRIRTAFREKFRPPRTLPPYDDGPWVDEIFQTYVIAEYKGKFFRVSYVDTGAAVTFGDISEVERSWQPVMNGAKAFSIEQDQQQTRPEDPVPPVPCAGSEQRPQGSFERGGDTLGDETKVKEFESKIATLMTENATLKAKAQEVEAEKARLFAEKRKSDIQALVHQAKTEGRVLPRFERELVALMESASESVEVQFSVEGKTTEKLSQFEAAKRLLAALPKAVEFDEKSAGGGSKPEKGDVPDPETDKKAYSELLAQKAKEYAEKHKVSIRDATIAADRELRKEASG